MRAMLTPSANDGPGFHSDMPVSELAESDTRAIEASVISSAPPIAKTTDGVTHETRLTPNEPHGAQRLEPLDPNLGIHLTGVRRLARQGLEAASCRTEPGEKMQMSPSGVRPTAQKWTWSSQSSRSILTSSQARRISIKERLVGHLSRSPEQHGHLPGGDLRSSGMPHEGYADPVSE